MERVLRVCSLIILSLALVAPASAVSTFNLDVRNSAPPGGSVQVDVVAGGLVDLYAWQFSGQFDPSVLHISNATEGALLATAGPTFFSPGVFDNTAGSLSFAFDTLIGPGPGIKGSGVLASLFFERTSAGPVALLFSDVLALDSGGGEIAVLATPALIPEPSVLTLALFGLFALGVRRSACKRPSGRSPAA